MKKLVSLLVLPILVASCGGGGGGGGSAPYAGPYMVKSVVTFADTSFTNFTSILPSALEIPANAVSGLFSSPNSFNNGEVTFSSAPTSSGDTLPLVNYSQSFPVLTNPEFSQFVTGGAVVWPRARFGLYSTARKTSPTSKVVNYIDMPYAVVKDVPTSASSGAFTNSAGRAAGVLASSARFPWLRCVASANLTVVGSTRTVVLTLSNCKDALDSAGNPSGATITLANPTITLITADNTSFNVTGSPSFTYGTTNPTTFTPTSFRGDFQLAGTTSATEIVGRVYMTDGNDFHGAFAFGVKLP